MRQIDYYMPKYKFLGIKISALKNRKETIFVKETIDDFEIDKRIYEEEKK